MLSGVLSKTPKFIHSWWECRACQQRFVPVALDLERRLRESEAEKTSLGEGQIELAHNLAEAELLNERLRQELENAQLEINRTQRNETNLAQAITKFLTDFARDDTDVDTILGELRKVLGSQHEAECNYSSC